MCPSVAADDVEFEVTRCNGCRSWGRSPPWRRRSVTPVSFRCGSLRPGVRPAGKLTTDIDAPPPRVRACRRAVDLGDVVLLRRVDHVVDTGVPSAARSSKSELAQAITLAADRLGELDAAGPHAALAPKIKIFSFGCSGPRVSDHEQAPYHRQLANRPRRRRTRPRALAVEGFLIATKSEQPPRLVSPINAVRLVRDGNDLSPIPHRLRFTACAKLDDLFPRCRRQESSAGASSTPECPAGPLDQIHEGDRAHA